MEEYPLTASSQSFHVFADHAQIAAIVVFESVYTQYSLSDGEFSDLSSGSIGCRSGLFRNENLEGDLRTGGFLSKGR